MLVGAVVVIVALGAAIAPKIGPVYQHPLLTFRLLRTPSSATLPVPVDGVRTRDLRDTWNGPRPNGRQHRGIDIFARRGTPIRSATDGIVATVGTNRLGGLIVRVLGPAGEWHYYAHLESFGRIREGDRITKGAILGFVGDSGNARGTPPHLHYGIYRFQGGAMNPYPRLAGRVGRSMTR
jgi:murein DD-endopeptidase MepM/ murein hydrolase activator NlpD